MVTATLKHTHVLDDENNAGTQTSVLHYRMLRLNFLTNVKRIMKILRFLYEMQRTYNNLNFRKILPQSYEQSEHCKHNKIHLL